MKKTAIYVDTSVIGGCYDLEFEEWSWGLLNDFKAGIFSLFLSVLTDAEIEGAPDDVKSVYAEFRGYAKEIIELTPEAVDLAEAYIDHKILAQNYRDDARHIAMATVAGVNLLEGSEIQCCKYRDGI